MDDKIGRYFGLVIGIVIPGFVGLYAISFFVPVVAAWLGIVAQASTGIGGFLFALLGSIGMGLFVGGIRALILDRRFPGRVRPNYSRRHEPSVESAYLNILAAHYPYYQFYSGMMFALGLLYLAWLTTWPPTMRVVAVSLLLVVGEIVLYLSAVDAITRFLDKRLALLGPAGQETATA